MVVVKRILDAVPDGKRSMKVKKGEGGKDFTGSTTLGIIGLVVLKVQLPSIHVSTVDTL